MASEQFECFVRKGHEIDLVYVPEELEGVETIENVDQAFYFLMEESAWGCGHDGGTGTIAEKDIWFPIGEIMETEENLEKAMTSWGFLSYRSLPHPVELDWDHDQVVDKYGPAGYYEVKNTTGEIFGWLFYGNADA